VTVRLLLDTHAFLWAVRAPAKLSSPATEAISSRDNELIVPASVAWELAIKYRLGKLPEAEPIVTDYAAVLLRLGAASWPITHAHTLQAGLLSWQYRDPFDRLLAAIAIREGIALVSKDSVFDELPDVRRIW
jgi:PIN domain nuclease of toxin-antitoxin system